MVCNTQNVQSQYIKVNHFELFQLSVYLKIKVLKIETNIYINNICIIFI